ncbi:DnaJ domain-containing protein, partial [Paraburkholderia bengalensis]
MKIHSHYDNLKVSRDAPQEVIRAAYKTLSQKYHPDRRIDDPDAERVMKIINASYAVLSDPAQRKEHDEWLARKEREAAAAAPSRPAASASSSASPASGAQANAQAAAQARREPPPRPR